jgi:hypothetical protein
MLVQNVQIQGFGPPRLHGVLGLGVAAMGHGARACGNIASVHLSLSY